MGVTDRAQRPTLQCAIKLDITAVAHPKGYGVEAAAQNSLILTSVWPCIINRFDIKAAAF